MTILAGDGGARRCADMGEEKMRMQVTAQIPEVFVRPGRPSFTVKAGFGMTAIPPETKSVAVGCGSCL